MITISSCILFRPAERNDTNWYELYLICTLDTSPIHSIRPQYLHGCTPPHLRRPRERPEKMLALSANLRFFVLSCNGFWQHVCPSPQQQSTQCISLRLQRDQDSASCSRNAAQLGFPTSHDRNADSPTLLAPRYAKQPWKVSNINALLLSRIPQQRDHELKNLSKTVERHALPHGITHSVSRCWMYFWEKPSPAAIGTDVDGLVSCTESLGNLHASRQNNSTVLILHVGTWSHIMSNGCPPGSRQIGGSGSSWSCFAHHKAAAKNDATRHTGEQPKAGTPAKPDRDWRGTSCACACLQWKGVSQATRLPLFGSAPFKPSCERALFARDGPDVFLWSVGCKAHLAAKNPPMGGAIKGPRSIDAKSSPAT